MNSTLQMPVSMVYVIRIIHKYISEHSTEDIANHYETSPLLHWSFLLLFSHYLLIWSVKQVKCFLTFRKCPLWVLSENYLQISGLFTCWQTYYRKQVLIFRCLLQQSKKVLINPGMFPWGQDSSEDFHMPTLRMWS